MLCCILSSYSTVVVALLWSCFSHILLLHWSCCSPIIILLYGYCGAAGGAGVVLNLCFVVESVAMCMILPEVGYKSGLYVKLLFEGRGWGSGEGWNYTRNGFAPEVGLLYR